MAFKKKEVCTDDFATGQMPDIILKDGTLATSGNVLEAIDKPLNADYMAEIAFMEEPIEVVVMETGNENDENPVTVGVNGIFKQFFRGQPTVAKRKFVEGLIVKGSRVTTPEVQNGAGERTYAIRQHAAHKYPFTVRRDDNPKGQEWLSRRMAEAL